MANAWASTLLALDPAHVWALDEASGNWQDSGSTGDLELIESGGLTDRVWRRAPGPVRATPRVFALWTTPTDGTTLERTSSGVSTSGVTTGAIGGVIRATSFSGGNCYIIFGNYSTGSFQVRINSSNLKVVCSIFGTGGTISLTSPNAITLGDPLTIMVVQRGDSTGLHMFINGVDVGGTTSFSGGANIDSFLDVITTSATLLSIGGDGTSGSSNGAAVVSSPYLIFNSQISDFQALSLHASASFENDATDFAEVIFDIGNFQVALSGYVAGVTGNCITEVLSATANQTAAQSWGAGTSEQNVLSTAGVTKQIVSDYGYVHFDYAQPGGSNPFIGNNGIEFDTNSSTGTVHLIIVIEELTVGLEKMVINYGDGGSIGLDRDNFFISLASSSLGYKWKYVLEKQNSTDFYQALSGDFLKVADDITLFSLVQDGNGIVMYIDGESVNFDVTSSGVSLDATSWFNDIFDNSGPEPFTIGGRASAGTVQNLKPENQIHGIYATKTIATSADIKVLWDAINGVFPEDSAFVALLKETGNGGKGPDWWWRCNETSGQLADSGIAQNRVIPIVATTITAGGDPIFDVAGPLPEDGTNAAIYFDGTGDFFEVGVNGVTGELVDSSTGSVGFFFSRNSLDDENIVYSQANDAYTSYWTVGLNENQAELIVQTSAGNSATFLSSIELDIGFHFIVLTNNGSNYIMYIDGAADNSATLTLVGTGANGNWFDDFTADNSAIAARANATFTTETTGRISELFIYDGEVLTASEILALYNAAVEDGITGSPNTIGLLSFENVTFLNGALGDIHTSQATSGTLQQVVLANRCNFLGGAQGSETYRPRIARIRSIAHVEFRGCNADILATPSFGRGGIGCTSFNNTVASTTYGSLIVSDCDFNQIGYFRSSDNSFIAPVHAIAAFGMTVSRSRFTNSNGTAIGWNADAQRVSVLDNIIDTVTAALGGIKVDTASNATLGSGWLIRGNQINGVEGNAIDITGATSEGNFARNIAIIGNAIDDPTAVGISVTQVGDVLIEDNAIDLPTEGIRLGEVQNSFAVRRNQITNNTETGIIVAESAEQIVVLNVDGNFIDGGLVGDGITINNVRRAILNGNKLIDVDIGIQIGEITVECLIDNSQVINATTPFALISSTTQVGLVFGTNQIESLGNQTELTIASETIEVVAHNHSITAASTTDLSVIDGPSSDGFLVVLRRAPFSEDITVIDSSTINLAGGLDFLMDTDDDQLWLVRDGTAWNELSRHEAL